MDSLVRTTVMARTIGNMEMANNVLMIHVRSKGKYASNMIRSMKR